MCSWFFQRLEMEMLSGPHCCCFLALNMDVWVWCFVQVTILWPWGKDQGNYTDVDPDLCHPSAVQLWTYHVRKRNPLWYINDRTGFNFHPFLYPHPLQYDFIAASTKRQSPSLHSLKSKLATCLALVAGYGRSDIVPVLSLGPKKPLTLSLTLWNLTAVWTILGQPGAGTS